ncbi:hypothetical protein KA005_49485 [bacterium]|nr:hypothetical protein [bacterium]
MDSRPLWMPTGSVRALLAITAMGGYVGLCAYLQNVEALGLVAILVAKDYFDSKKV